MIRIFVYGSLMKNCYNHDYYLQGQKYLGQAILFGYALYNLGSFPGIIPDQEGKVRGEVYEIDDSTLARLDILEGNGSLYIRQTAQVWIKEEAVHAKVYVWKGEVRPEDKIELCAQPWSA
jgi:gamma-glutamylcyclotransferase (GGCT)/AIG2-like uncharacterized protein YtfP